MAAARDDVSSADSFASAPKPARTTPVRPSRPVGRDRNPPVRWQLGRNRSPEPKQANPTALSAAALANAEALRHQPGNLAAGYNDSVAVRQKPSDDKSAGFTTGKKFVTDHWFLKRYSTPTVPSPTVVDASNQTLKTRCRYFFRCCQDDILHPSPFGKPRRDLCMLAITCMKQ